MKPSRIRKSVHRFGSSLSFMAWLNLSRSAAFDLARVAIKISDGLVAAIHFTRRMS